jgi:hypothetical protein
MRGSITKGERPEPPGALLSKEVAARNTAWSKGKMGGGAAGAAGAAAGAATAGLGIGAAAVSGTDGAGRWSAGGLASGAAQAASKLKAVATVQPDTVLNFMDILMGGLRFFNFVNALARIFHGNWSKAERSEFFC